MLDILKEPSLIRQRWLPTNLAIDEIVGFESRFGEKHSILACHAALPMFITPEIINLIHVNFLSNKDVPCIAEMDFLLSPICRLVNSEKCLYEIEPGVREILLIDLENRFGEKRVLEIAKFLRCYLYKKKDREKFSSDVEKILEWISKAYDRPEEVIKNMQEHLKYNIESNKPVNNVKIFIATNLLKYPLHIKEDYFALENDTKILERFYNKKLNPDILNDKNINILVSPFLREWLKLKIYANIKR